MSGRRPIGAAIVDDEAPARALLRQLLSAHGDFAIVAEFADGATALGQADRLMSADILFLDIRMPGLDGVALARALARARPSVVFVTAHEGHAVEAFEIEAFDYVLKPIDKRRFAEVLERVRREVRRRRAENVLERLSIALAGESAAAGSDASALKIATSSGARWLPAHDIVWVEAANQYVNVHTLRGPLLLSSESLHSLERKLDPRLMLRVHRRALVNREHIASVHTDRSGRLIVEMDDGAEIVASRRRRSRLAGLLREHLGQDQ